MEKTFGKWHWDRRPTGLITLNIFVASDNSVIFCIIFKTWLGKQSVNIFCLNGYPINLGVLCILGWYETIFILLECQGELFLEKIAKTRNRNFWMFCLAYYKDNYSY